MRIACVKILRGTRLIEANAKALDRIYSRFKFRRLYRTDEVEEYLKDVFKISDTRTYVMPLRHKTLETTIARNLSGMAWNAKQEVHEDSYDYSYVHDVVAKKDSRILIVEVKPIINARIISQILPYLRHVQNTHDKNKARVLLGTDLSNARTIIENKDILGILFDYAQDYDLGVTLADTKDMWLIPDGFLIEIPDIVDRWKEQ